MSRGISCFTHPSPLESPVRQYHYYRDPFLFGVSDGGPCPTAILFEIFRRGIHCLDTIHDDVISDQVFLWLELIVELTPSSISGIYGRVSNNPNPCWGRPDELVDFFIGTDTVSVVKFPSVVLMDQPTLKLRILSSSHASAGACETYMLKH